MASLQVYAKSAMPSKQSKWHHLYNTSRWRALRRWFLSQPDNMFCRIHRDNNQWVIATIPDHIIPHKGNEELFWDVNNLQPLCKTCHDSRKKLQEYHGYSQACDVNGNPIDKQHPWNKKQNQRHTGGESNL